MTDNYMKLYHRSPKCIQTLGINIVELKRWRLQRSKEFSKWYAFLRKTEHWNKKEFIDYQNKHLRKILIYANKHVPFYHDLYKKENVDVSKIKTIKDLKKLPIVKKEDIQNHWNAFISNQKEKHITRHTSGTTGKPLTIQISYKLDLLDKANWLRRDVWAGYDGGWTARFVGDNPVIDCSTKQLFRKSYVMKRALFPTHCLSLETLPQIFNDLKKINIQFIQCYPSAGYLLAKYLDLNDEYFPLKAILYSSEPMYDFQRELIKKRFKTKVFGFYGQAEEVVSAVECENENLHLTMVDGITEIQNNDKSISPNKKGYTIVTSLHNYTMPLIRYALNDYTGFKDEECNCGRTSPLIHLIETKSEDFIITPNGKFISPSILTFPFKNILNIVESQIIQETTEKLRIRIVKTKGYKEEDEQKLIQSLGQLLEGLSIQIEYVEKIHSTKSHKKRFIINKIGKDYLEKAFEKIQ